MWLLPVRLLRFSRRVVVAFFRNRGLLLSAGVGYNALLSMIPFFAVVITALSYVIPRNALMTVVTSQLDRLVPRYSQDLVKVVEAYLDSRHVIGVIGTLILLFFSSLAFRMLEEAMELIFHRSQARLRRRRWVSLAIPYAFIAALAVALLLVTLIRGMLTTLGQQTLVVNGAIVSLAAPARGALQVMGFASQVVLFASLYKVLPVARIALRRALLGGLFAASMWAVVSRLLIYYFATLSMVNIIYGSLATVIVVLLIMEAASIIILIGAQIIAELEQSAAAGVPWHQPPPTDRLVP